MHNAPRRARGFTLIEVMVVIVILGVLAADSGSVTLDGAPLSPTQRQTIGYMPEERGLYPKMRVLDHIVYLARLHGFGKADATERAEADRTVANIDVATKVVIPQHLAMAVA